MVTYFHYSRLAVITEEGKSWPGLELNLSGLLVVSTWNSKYEIWFFLELTS